MAHVVDTTYGRNRDLGQVTDPVLLAYYAGLGYTIDGTVTATVPGPPSQVVVGVPAPYGSTDGEVLTIQGSQVIAAPPTGGGGGGAVSSVFGRTGAVSLTKADVTGTGLAAIDIGGATSLPENATALTASGNLTIGKVTPINSTTGAVVATLPAGSTDGQTIGVRFKTGSNAASVTGTISGATNTIVLIAGELLVFRWDAGTSSWWSQAGNKPLTALDTRYAAAGNYAPLADPAFTGNPTAPTQAAADNSTKLATTAYADRAAAGGATKAQALGYALIFGGI